MNVKHIKGLLVASKTMVDATLAYLGSVWFLGVGLATMVILCNLPIKQEYYQIGYLVGIITICVLPLVALHYITNNSLDKLEKEGV